MSTYKITAEENVPVEIRDGYEVIMSGENEALLRKKLEPEKDFHDGDYVAIIENGTVKYIALFKKYNDLAYDDICPYAYINKVNALFVPVVDYVLPCCDDIRRATDDEIQKMNFVMKVNRWKWEWDAEDKHMVKLHEWPEYGESYYYIGFDVFSSTVKYDVNDSSETDKANIKAGNYFFESSAPQELSQKINNLISEYKSKRPK